MDAERLLGGLIRMGIGKGMKAGKKLHKTGLNMGIGTGTQATIGLGMLGVAMAAFEHFSGRDQTPAPTQYPSTYPQPTGTATTPVPPPPPIMSTPPPPPLGFSKTEECNEEAVFLIRAMIAAAHADGQIDADERKRLLDRFESAGLDSEERAFLLQELLSPVDLDTIVRQAATPELAREIYAASLLAIEADTEAEHTYLNTLAQRLAIQEETIQQIHQQLGLIQTTEKSEENA